MDEHIHPAVAKGLRGRGYDVLTTKEADKLGFSDEHHLEFATENERVIVTADQDFLRLAVKGIPHAGIIFLTSPEIPVGRVIQRIGKIAETLTAEDMKNHIEFIS